jgi:hypothetical protein
MMTKMKEDLLTKMKEERNTDQEKMAADKKDFLARMKEAKQGLLTEMKEDLLTKTKEDRKADQEKMAADKEDFLARMDAIHEKRMAMLDAHQKRMTACLGEMDANTEKIELDTGMMQSIEEHQDVPSEDVAVMPVKGLRKRRGIWKSTAGRRGEPKELNRGNHGSRRKLAATCRKVSRHAAMVWRKRKLFRRTGTQGICGRRKELAIVGMRTSRYATVAWRKRKLTRNIQIQESRESAKDFAVNGMRQGLGGKNGIRRQNVKKPPHLRIERKTASSSGGQHKREQRRLKGMSRYNDIYWRTIGLDFVKKVVRMPSGFLQIRIWRVWRGRPPPKHKKM